MSDRFAAPRRRLQDFARGPAGGALFGALVALGLLLALWWQAGQWYQARLLTEQRSEAAMETSLLGNALSSVINRRLARLQGLYAFVHAELETSGVSGEPFRASSEVWPAFEVFAAELYGGSRGIRNLAVAPAGVVRYVYPLAGNENVLGYEPSKDPRPEVRADVERAIASREVVFSGPAELVQGGQGLIARQAIYHQGRYWGLVNVVLDLPAVLHEAGLDLPSSDLSFALRDQQGWVFIGPTDLFEREPAVSRIDLPEGAWELAGVPADGWDGAVQGPLRVFQAAGLVIAFLLAGLVHLFVNRQARLTQAVRERTGELEEAYELLERRVQERTRELSTLLDVAHNIASTLDLNELLKLVLRQLRGVVDYSGAAILTLQEGRLTILDYHGSVPHGEAMAARYQAELGAGYQAVIQRREPVIIPDIWGDTPMARAVQDALGAELQAHYGDIHSWMGVPLLVHERLIGLLSLDHREANFYTLQHAQIALAFANHTAVAIENARLHAEARRLAVLEERQRIARELHDSVSQALYGIGLGARTARALLDRSPQEKSALVEPLEYVLAQADAGLAEMRALIFELRPDSLEKEGLVAALTKSAAALRARHGLEVQTEFCEEPALPFEVKEALYRIAQEALHNTVKHAQAGKVEIRLDDCQGQVILEVRDDGVGFDPGADYPGHLGLHSMRERAARLSGVLEIESQPGSGTSLRVTTPFSKEPRSEPGPARQSCGRRSG